MVRGIHTRKRSGGRLVRRSKRTRFTRRRRTARGRTTTSRASAAVSVGTFRARKTSTRRWRNMLWQDTIAKQHYRSLDDVSTPLSTPNTITDANFIQVSALPNNFWTAGGGAVSPDPAILLPAFTGDITLRGGIARIAVANRVNPVDTAPSDPVRVTIFAIWSGPNTSGFTFPVNPVPIMWEPSTIPDFSRYGRVQFKRETILKGDGEAVQCYFKFKPQKIDQSQFNLGGRKLVWFVLASQMTNTEGTPTAENLDVVTSHNISFSADAQ